MFTSSSLELRAFLIPYVSNKIFITELNSSDPDEPIIQLCSEKLIYRIGGRKNPGYVPIWLPGLLSVPAFTMCYLKTCLHATGGQIKQKGVVPDAKKTELEIQKA